MLPGAFVGARAVVERSIVMGRVGEHASLQRVVVGADGVISDNEQLTDVRRPDPDELP